MSYQPNKKGEIYFFTEDIEFTLDEKKKVTQWIKDTAEEYTFVIDNINYIFVSDNYLLGLNKKYLKHKTLTDIITFDNSFFNLGLSGDIYISVERVKENAVKYQTVGFALSSACAEFIADIALSPFEAVSISS